MARISLTDGVDNWLEADEPSRSNSSSTVLFTGKIPHEVTNSGLWMHYALYRPYYWHLIPDGAVIDDARLHVKVSHTRNNANNVPIQVRRNGGGWGNATTWNTRPPGTAAIYDTLNCSPGQVKLFNVTPWVNHARFNDHSWRGNGLYFWPELTTESGANFYSLEGSYKPWIRVDFHAMTPRITSVETISGVNGLRIVGDGYNGAGRVYLDAADSSSGPWGGIASTTTSYDAVNKWAVDDISLAPAPKAPNVSLSHSGNDITINWTGAVQNARTKYYKSITELADGTTWSAFSNIVGPHSYIPKIIAYRIDRKIGDNAWQNNIKTTVGSTRSFTDTGLPTDVTITYRVIAKNIQETWGAFGSNSISITKPTPPTFSSLTILNNLRFELLGSGAISGATIKVYRSLNGSTYAHVGNTTAHENDTWGWGEPPTVVSNPNLPTITSTNKEEGKIGLSWNIPTNNGTQHWYKVSRVINGVESNLTAAKAATLVPVIRRFVIKRKLSTESDSLFIVIRDTNNDPAGTPLPTSIIDNTVKPGTNYVYQITSYNNHGKLSIAVTPTITSALPAEPTVFEDSVYPKIITKVDGSQYVRIAGSGRKAVGETLADVDSIRVERSRDLTVWSHLSPDSGTQYTNPIEIIDGGNTQEQWFRNDTSITVSAPRIPEWNLTARPVDTDGIHLRWKTSSNLLSQFYYRGKRIIRGVAGYPSNHVTATITPKIVSYSIQRRLNPLSVVDTTQIDPTEFDWKLVHVVYPPEGSTTPPTTWTDYIIKDPLSTEEGIRYDRVYDYRIIANNNFNLSSSADSAKVMVLSTVNAPPPPPPPPPPTPPVVSDGSPSGTINVSGVHPLRLVWNYYHPEGEKQTAYILSVRWISGGSEIIRYWDATEGAWTINEKKNLSNNNHTDVSLSIFESGTTYTLKVITQAESGGWSI